WLAEGWGRVNEPLRDKCVLRLFCCLYNVHTRVHTHECGRRPRRPTMLFFSQNSVLFWKFFLFYEVSCVRSSPSLAGKDCLLSVCCCGRPPVHPSILQNMLLACVVDTALCCWT
ncbi:unnamed protein product, partial [Ectocarpus sp. 4 AP-2014]